MEKVVCLQSFSVQSMDSEQDREICSSFYDDHSYVVRVNPGSSFID